VNVTSPDGFMMATQTRPEMLDSRLSLSESPRGDPPESYRKNWVNFFTREAKVKI
jgi:hypothetical protein